MIPKYFTGVLAILLLFCSCSKDNAGTNTADLNTGTGTGGSLAKFTIVGNYLYIVENSTLYAYNITDAANPVETSSSYLSASVETIYPFNNLLFIGSTTGLFIYSITDPANPVQSGTAIHARSCDPVVANDSIAYVTLKGSSFCGEAESGLYVHNVKNVYDPHLIKIVHLNSPEGLGLNGSTLYVCCNNDGLKVYNVSNPVDPVEIRTLADGYFKDVIVYGNLLICYISTGTILYDITDATNPVQLRVIENN